MRTLSRLEARRVYDRIGRLQDSQAFYENRPIDTLLRRGDFAAARAVFEFGCGTGRLARRLLDEQLSSAARYRGVDVSPRMVGLARARLAAYADRADVVLTAGEPPAGEAAGSFDRFLSTYVLDLLSEEDISALVREAARILRPGGLLCLVSLSTGVSRPSRIITRLWSGLQARCPALVGGCRPIDLVPFLPETEWTVRHREKILAFGVPSEVVIAECRARLTDGSASS
jgi:SAM-dependent methyltransferase